MRQGLLGRGCSTIPLLHLKIPGPRILRNSVVTRVAQQKSPFFKPDFSVGFSQILCEFYRQNSLFLDTPEFCHGKFCWKSGNYHHHPESKKRKSSEASSGSIHPYGRYGNAVKTRKTISTIAIFWPVKAIFEKRAATVEVDTLIFLGNSFPAV